MEHQMCYESAGYCGFKGKDYPLRLFLYSQDNWLINTQLQDEKVDVKIVVNYVKQRYMKGEINCAFISEKLSKKLKHSEDESTFVALFWQIKLTRKKTEMNK